ncbi:MAG: hypothetical protein LAP87_11010 [Acidobacteriia bacterium]|nr:hypothetical protein [Terriglobia bacterium]
MFTAARIRELLDALNAELAAEGVRGELFLAGGAVMCLVFHAREATKDIDALLVPATELRRAADEVAKREHLPPHWLNDAVKGFFSESGRFEVYAELSHLRIFAPHPEYLLAMKCLAMRLGEEFQDRADVLVLLKILGLHRMEDVESALARYYPLERYPAKARYTLEDLLGAGGA